MQKLLDERQILVKNLADCEAAGDLLLASYYRLISEGKVDEASKIKEDLEVIRERANKFYAALDGLPMEKK